MQVEVTSLQCQSEEHISCVQNLRGSLRTFSYLAPCESYARTFTQRLVRPIFFSFPLLFSAHSLHRFTEKVCGTPALGRQVHVLATPDTYAVPCRETVCYNVDLCTLLPHLTSLRHFITCFPQTIRRSPISAEAFTLLAEAAGDTILTIAGLYLPKRDSVSPAAFNSFKKLTKLHLNSSPSILEGQTDFSPEALSSLRKLSLTGVPDFAKTFPGLRHVRCPFVLVGWALTVLWVKGYLI